MPALERPPMSPQAQAQMGAPGFGPGFQQATQQQGKNPMDIAVSTVEKILLGVQGEKFQEAVKQAIAILKTGAARQAQEGPQSGGAAPMPGQGPGPQVAGPPVPGPMPG